MTDKKAEKQTLAQKAAAEKQSKVVTIEQLLAGTEAGKIWDEIKDKDVEIFALPEQKVFQHASPAVVEPSKLYLLCRSAAALPAIETAVSKKFNVERVDKYAVVSRKEVPLTQK